MAKCCLRLERTLAPGLFQFRLFYFGVFYFYKLRVFIKCIYALFYLFSFHLNFITNKRLPRSRFRSPYRSRYRCRSFDSLSFQKKQVNCYWIFPQISFVFFFPFCSVFLFFFFPFYSRIFYFHILSEFYIEFLVFTFIFRFQFISFTILIWRQ